MFHPNKSIPNIPDNWILVFGSNLAGNYGAGIPLEAVNYYGASPTVVDGINGNSYSIPVKDSKNNPIHISLVKKSIDKFKEYVRANPTVRFWITNIEADIPEYTTDRMASMFNGCGSNCSYPEDWKPYITDRYYTVLPGRVIPIDMLERMREIGMLLATRGYTIRSSETDKIERAFSEGVDSVNGYKDIWMPKSILKHGNTNTIQQRHIDVVKSVHPSYSLLNIELKTTFSRVAGQILGTDVSSRVDFIVCYSRIDLKKSIHVNYGSGVVEVAAAIASTYKIPLYNLFVEKDIEKLLDSTVE